MSHYGWPAHQRLCYYPSSGHRLLWVVMQIDCDSFVLSDSYREHNSPSLRIRQTAGLRFCPAPRVCSRRLRQLN